MKRIVTIGLVAMLAATLLSACGGGAGGEPIKIGVLSMITGDMASNQYGDLARLAAKEVNDKGGINGRPLQIVEEDEGGSPEKAILAFTKLAERDNVTVVIGPVLSHVAAAVQPKANERKVPVIGFNFGTILDATAGRYYFRHMISDNMGSDALVKYLLAQMPASNLKVGVIHDKTPVGASAQATFVAALKNAGINPVGVEGFEMGATTYIPYLQHLKDAGANIVYPGTVTGPVMGIMRDLGVMGWRPMVVGGLGFGNNIGYKMSGGSWDGVRYWSYIDFSRKDVIDFSQRLKKELNQTFESELNVSFYETTNMVAEILKKSGSDKEAFRDTLENFQWDQTLVGPPGTVVRYTPQRHVGFSSEAHVVNQWNAGGVVSTIWRGK